MENNKISETFELSEKILEEIKSTIKRIEMEKQEEKSLRRCEMKKEIEIKVSLHDGVLKETAIDKEEDGNPSIISYEFNLKYPESLLTEVQKRMNICMKKALIKHFLDKESEARAERFKKDLLSLFLES